MFNPITTNWIKIEAYQKEAVRIITKQEEESFIENNIITQNGDGTCTFKTPLGGHFVYNPSTCYIVCLVKNPKIAFPIEKSHFDECHQDHKHVDSNKKICFLYAGFQPIKIESKSGVEIVNEGEVVSIDNDGMPYIINYFTQIYDYNIA